METLSKTSCTLFEGCPFFSMGNCHPGHVCFQVAHGCVGLCCFCGRYGAGVTGSFSRLEAPTSATSSHTIPWELESLPLFFIIPQWVGGHASASDFTRRAKRHAKLPAYWEIIHVEHIDNCFNKKWGICTSSSGYQLIHLLSP